MNTKSDRLKAARLARRITLKHAAEELHVAVATYKGWEAGAEPRSLETAARVCDYLGISLDYYVTGRQSAQRANTPQQDRMITICDTMPDNVLEQMLDTMELVSDMLLESNSIKRNSE